MDDQVRVAVSMLTAEGLFKSMKHHGRRVKKLAEFLARERKGQVALHINQYRGHPTKYNRYEDWLLVGQEASTKRVIWAVEIDNSADDEIKH